MKLALSLIGIGLFALGIATWRSHGHTPNTPTQLFVGIDASESARPDLGSYGMFVTALAQQLAPGEDRLTLYRVERRTEEFRDGVFDGDAEALLKSVTAGVRPAASGSRTLPEAFWQEAARRARGSRSPVSVCLLSDGDNDDLRPTSDAAIREAAGALAGCPNVRTVAVVGARRENWQRLRQALAPLGDRLQLLSPTDVTPERAQNLLAR